MLGVAFGLAVTVGGTIGMGGASARILLGYLIMLDADSRPTGVDALLATVALLCSTVPLATAAPTVTWIV